MAIPSLLLGQELCSYGDRNLDGKKFTNAQDKCFASAMAFDGFLVIMTLAIGILALLKKIPPHSALYAQIGIGSAVILGYLTLVGYRFFEKN